LQDLLNQHNKSHNYAVAVNRQFVARSQYAQTILKEQDQIDIIQPMQGG